jgi:hypothetical protein
MFSLPIHPHLPSTPNLQHGTAWLGVSVFGTREI